MELENQILNVEQIKELRELGFDVNKHASVEINTTINKKQYVVSSSFVQLYPEFGDDNVIERYSTMTIGDIISVLPVIIKEEYFLSVNSEYCTYSMIEGLDTIFYTWEKEPINNLFKTLVWCIKNKYITL
ncbi:MAG: hypothetical protein M0R46_15160 [Candidatus Muirbacterium halophilum]|nr:hypothetical protein [Candidatus Muirbacterium halophilum]